MNTYLKISSTEKNKSCNCISPFYIDSITGINPNTGHDYNDDDKDILKTALFRISNAKGCNVSVCCDPNDPTSMPDANFTSTFINKFPKIMPMYEGSNLTSIKLSTTANVKESGWQTPSTHMICKITKATITDTKDPTIKIAKNLVTDCYTDQCNQAETITMNNLLQNAKSDMSYTSVDDARVTQAIRESNITYVKTYIRKYKQVNSPLTNDTYNNRMIHIASECPSLEILNMLIALKANLNITNVLSETPIFFAIRNGNIQNIDTLLNQGVDLTIVNKKGESAMFYAMKSGDMRIINMLYNNTAPMLGIDNEGNNLIQYCIKNCPSFKDVDPNLNNSSNNSSNGITNSKSQIIKFLIDHGVSTEQVNIAGISPLETVEKQINKEINKECKLGISQDNDTINEAFFNIKPIREAFNSNTGGGGASKQNIDNDTLEHKSLLEIQTMLFNNIIKNNPNKYNDYINVADIPKGAPIQILDTVCYGSGMTGNEDSEECISKGGQLVKIKNKTTKIKLELTPDDNASIDAVKQKDLYYPKNPAKLPKGTIPVDIKNYNDTITNNSSSNIINQIPQTTGITYNIGQESTNMLDSIETSLGFNPQPTQAIINTKEPATPATPKSNIPEITINQLDDSSDNSSNNSSNNSPDHPPMFNDDDESLHKCKQDAIRNSIKITEAQTTQPQTTKGNITLSGVIDKYKTPLIILIVVIVLLIIIIGYQYMKNRSLSQAS